MKTDLRLQLGHQLSMTPQLQQAIRLLLLSTADLQTEIQQALDSNSMLELVEDSLTDFLQAKDSDGQEPWENWIRSQQTSSQGQGSNNLLETMNAEEISLQDHLRWQMQLTPFSESDHLIATIIIDSINDDGYLSASVDDIVTTIKPMLEVDKAEVKAVLHRIQQFDPLGVGSQNVEECLLVQLAQIPSRAPWVSKAQLLIKHYLPLLAKRDHAALKSKLRVSSEELHEIIAGILHLNPKPGTRIGRDSCEYIIPDVFIFMRNNQWEVALNPLCTPTLKVNRQYAGLIRRQDASRDNQFMRDQLQQARWFIKSIKNRNETLLKVARCIAKEQEAFLNHGEEAMKPLTLGQIAQMVDMHESTISRVTTQKFIHTTRGVFELKYFFSSHITTDSGLDCSATAIRALIKKYILAENKTKPLSDLKLCQLLEEQGIQVARRTIAKYREALTIPASNERKQSK